ncbi:MAG: hypothetical protein C0626_02125 [Arcobacter sp.]|uniref:hypothetical protein n=1 Tax=uncultured Arcobacter sp. TaxID=165434 RepID=UPI000CB2B16B|nr:hypothetical protein [uncultured Arcobacter sp.]PLY11389.1 MAG: hypothetical protein C0626_02125 [Arcobacter sp.]
MATRKIEDKKKLEELQKKTAERLKSSKLTAEINFNMRFKKYEIAIIKRKTKSLRIKYDGLTRAEVLRKVLLNLDDEELICFLNLLPSDRLKK